MSEYDYVIVGAGTAGCILARRLTEGSDCSVLLLEAGSQASSWRFDMPMAWPTLLSNKTALWRYHDRDAVSPKQQLVGGRLVGGSSSVNAMSFVRGHRSDFDRWAKAGLTGMSYDDVLPYFRRMENWQGSDSPYRGKDGPVPVAQSRLEDPALTALMQAADAQGARTYIDCNEPEPSGFGLTQLTVAGGRRASAATCYLAPALAAGARVQLVTGALATRVVLEKGTAVGVQYCVRGENRTARASREVIVAASGVQSPQLLMLSGIGDPATLHALGITVEAALPGVGRNLRNHVSLGLQYARRHPGPIGRGLRLDRLAGAAIQWFAGGEGFLATPPNAAMGFIETPESRGIPDIQILFFSTTPQARPYWPLVQHPYTDGFTLTAVLLRPESTGSIELPSADPLHAPRVSQNRLATQRDRETLAHGIRRIDALAHEKALRAVSAGPLGDHPSDLSHSELDSFIRVAAMPMFHLSGSCRMGPEGDRMSVVDSRFRVYGMRNLRVIDASVMPDLIGGNPFACVAMLAEKASDDIRGNNKPC